MGIWGFWSLDIFTLLASSMSTSAFAAQSIIRTIGYLLVMLPLTCDGCATVLVGNAVG